VSVTVGGVMARLPLEVSPGYATVTYATVGSASAHSNLGHSTGRLVGSR
jgi:hypothetical protein